VAYGGKKEVLSGLKAWFAKNKEGTPLQKIETNAKGQIESYHQVQ